MPDAPAKICPFLSIGASSNANPEMIGRGILVIYAACTKDCMLFIPNRLTEGGTCGLSREIGMLVKGSAN